MTASAAWTDPTVGKSLTTVLGKYRADGFDVIENPGAESLPDFARLSPLPVAAVAEPQRTSRVRPKLYATTLVVVHEAPGDPRLEQALRDLTTAARQAGYRIHRIQPPKRQLARGRREPSRPQASAPAQAA